MLDEHRRGFEETDKLDTEWQENRVSVNLLAKPGHYCLVLIGQMNWYNL